MSRENGDILGGIQKGLPEKLLTKLLDEEVSIAIVIIVAA